MPIDPDVEVKLEAIKSDLIQIVSKLDEHDSKFEEMFLTALDLQEQINELKLTQPEPEPTPTPEPEPEPEPEPLQGFPTFDGTGCPKPTRTLLDAVNNGLDLGTSWSGSGTPTIKRDGCVIDGVVLPGIIRIYAKDVVIRNCWQVVNSGSFGIDCRNTGLVVENHVSIANTDTHNAHIVSKGQATYRNVRMTGCGDLIKLYDGDHIENSYLETWKLPGSAKHNDACQSNVTGSNDVPAPGKWTARNCTVKAHADRGGNSTFIVTGGVSGVVEDSFLDGGNMVLNGDAVHAKNCVIGLRHIRHGVLGRTCTQEGCKWEDGRPYLGNEGAWREWAVE